MDYDKLKHPVVFKYHALRTAHGCVWMMIVPRFHFSENIVFAHSLIFLQFLYYLRTQLVGDDPVSSAVVKKCINDWIASGPDAVQSLPLGGSILEVCCGHSIRNMLDYMVILSRSAMSRHLQLAHNLQ